MKTLVLSYLVNGKVCTVWEKWGCIYYGIIPTKEFLQKGKFPDGGSFEGIEFQTKCYTTFQEAHQELMTYATLLTTTVKQK